MISNGPIISWEAASDTSEWAHLISQLQLPIISNRPIISPEAAPNALEWAYFASQWKLPMVSNGPIIFSEASPDANEWAHLRLQRFSLCLHARYILYGNGCLNRLTIYIRLINCVYTVVVWRFEKRAQ